SPHNPPPHSPSSPRLPYTTLFRSVIVSAGAIGSPHLLQLSGVGGPEVLQKAGIAVLHSLPGVGQNFQDHYIARMSCYVRNLETRSEEHTSELQSRLDMVCRILLET